MLANFFNNSKHINSIILFAGFICIYIVAFLGNNIAFNVLDFPAFLVVFVLIIYIDAKNNLTFDNSYTLLFFVLLIGFFIKVVALNTTFFANVFLLLFFKEVYSLQKGENILQKLYGAGFWLGASFILEPFSVIFGGVLCIAILLHYKVNIQTISLPFLGFITPVFLFFTYCFWYDKLTNFTTLFLKFTTYRFTWFESSFMFPVVFIGVFLIIAVLIKTPRVLPVKNLFRKSWILTLYHFIIAIVFIIFSMNKNGSEFLYVFLPTAVILANGFELISNKWLSNGLLLMFIIASFTFSFI